MIHQKGTDSFNGYKKKDTYIYIYTHAAEVGDGQGSATVHGVAK